MPQIINTLKPFMENLQNKKPVVCDQTGKWEVEGTLKHFIRKLFCTEESRLMNIAKAFSQALDDFETTPLRFTDKNIIVKEQAEVIHDLVVSLDCIFDLFEKHYNVLHNKTPSLFDRFIKKNTQYLQSIRNLEARVNALTYRMDLPGYKLDQSQINPKLKEQLISLALDWKAKQEIMVDKSLTEKDLAKIDEACCFPEFIYDLLMGDKIKSNFFEWSLRDNNRPSLFIEFPATCRRIKLANLANRAGKFGQDILRIEKVPINNSQGFFEKVLTMPFFNGTSVESVSVLDGNREVVLNEGWRLSINKIFDLFAQKTFRPTDLEFFADKGVMNWHTYYQGSWDPSTQSYKLVDISKASWLNELPITEVISKEDIEKRYNVNLMDGDNLVVLRANRAKASHTLEDRHTFLEVILKHSKGTYAIYPFSKYAETFPQSTFEKLRFLLATVPAKLAYPDENIFSTDRQHAAYPLKINDEQTKQLLDTIQQDLIKAREGNLIFQFRRENCAFWVQSTIDSVHTIKTPRLFKEFMVESHSDNPILESILSWIRRRSKSWQPKIVNAIDFLLGGSRGMTVIEKGQKVFKSFLQTPKDEQQEVFQPGCLHKHIENGTIKGIIFAGH